MKKYLQDEVVVFNILITIMFVSMLLFLIFVK